MMYKKNTYTVRSNQRIARDIYRMVLSGDTHYITAPGQFINISLDGLYLRRPISVCAYDADAITIIYKVVGEGTARMAGMKPHTELDILTGLGNGFTLREDKVKPLLIGGGVGVPPLYQLAKELTALGMEPVAILGFNASEDVFYEAEFRDLGCRVFVSTADGSYGIPGFVTDVMAREAIAYDYVYTCGPGPMLEAVDKAAKTSGQFSFEERMGCGFGGCMGCSCETKYGYKRICKEGPVLEREEIIWRTHA
ncbi:MAG: dihydroorotate dehydrogenase electron transfer subunit [Clostridiales bacterium]|nr:dihydroorotate dehydrogenase electron transfer subunit [Clostridiales bacterium]